MQQMISPPRHGTMINPAPVWLVSMPQTVSAGMRFAHWLQDAWKYFSMT